ncbi:uncharacterized protein MELLADRAFT_90672 [Melampsora larici-populina 98AG31]|uniref:CxC5 like cysteine cluster associated with KDZ domain-containing protein n=1 Tax=Melampsora larici-populina (strain 98AG31 / pathotype 3-4-7) TaxID=747676 RepID=F4RXR4_MELLP|nr:uncharacterized protein MELLADRAFT_90672 [Melampsora larici-populina 98AG31]EGG02774.1 hypothetical protein MELLADRAFT_90672 [Melampsora larici-populina 98AG31]
MPQVTFDRPHTKPPNIGHVSQYHTPHPSNTLPPTNPNPAMLLRDFVNQLIGESPQLALTLSVTEFIRFTVLAAKVQQVAGDSLRLKSTRTTVIPFLASALSLEYPKDLMADLWRLAFPHLPGCDIDTSAAIREFGLQPTLTSTSKLLERFLRAPFTKCISCPEQSTLHVHSRINGYLYDTDGTHAVQTVILCCSNDTCGISYRPSYYTSHGFRIYDSQAMGRETDYLHIHCHYYMTARLAYISVTYSPTIVSISSVSHFNLVNWYNQLFVEDAAVAQFVPNQKFTPYMSDEVCRDGLIIHSLMKHADRRGTHLAVVSSGNNSMWFDSAIKDHLERLSVEGTTYRDHYCSSCVRIITQVDPETGEINYRSIRAVVTDGLTIGHYRCSASSQQLQEIAKSLGHPAPEGPCTNDLDNINNRFCPEHFVLLGGKCQAQPCPNAAIGNTGTCNDKDHIDAWANFNEKIKSNFSLTSILNRPGSSLRADPTVHLDADTAEFQDLAGLQQADESQRAHKAARDGGESKSSGKYLLSRMRTHNDQLVVGTCGIVLGRKTFYNAESVSAVKVSVVPPMVRGRQQWLMLSCSGAIPTGLP